MKTLVSSLAWVGVDIQQRRPLRVAMNRLGSKDGMRTMRARLGRLVAVACAGALLWGVAAQNMMPADETGNFSSTGLMANSRVSATATLLQNGKVSIATGYGSSVGDPPAALYDPTNGQFATTGSLNDVRISGATP